jgi:hypothetical protein
MEVVCSSKNVLHYMASHPRWQCIWDLFPPAGVIPGTSSDDGNTFIKMLLKQNINLRTKLSGFHFAKIKKAK